MVDDEVIGNSLGCVHLKGCVYSLLAVDGDSVGILLLIAWIRERAGLDSGTLG